MDQINTKSIYGDELIVGHTVMCLEKSNYIPMKINNLKRIMKKDHLKKLFRCYEAILMDENRKEYIKIFLYDELVNIVI